MKLLAALLLLMVGCDMQGPLRHCDYCAKDQPHVYAFGCDECKKYHWSCPNESAMKIVHWATTTIVACPRIAKDSP